MSRYKVTRRRFLGLPVALFTPLSLFGPLARADLVQHTSAMTKKVSASKKPTIGIALGAGGANGLTHILMLEALDEMGITPHRISGSSIGAIIGALYASGMSGTQIRKHVEQFIISPNEKLFEELVNKDALRWIEFIEIELGQGGLLNSEGFISYLYDALKHDTFEELKIPLRMVAADLWNRQQVVFDSGALLPAIKASMALPGVFEPVLFNDKVLVDGGTVNPVPYDLLTADCDIVIGIDVIGERSSPDTSIPTYFETIFNSVKVMQHAIMTEKLQCNKPAIYMAPRIVDIRALEFYRAEQIFAQAQPAKEELKRQLAQLL